jgi:hypothetical protein
MRRKMNLVRCQTEYIRCQIVENQVEEEGLVKMRGGLRDGIRLGPTLVLSSTDRRTRVTRLAFWQ